jgi:VWFA-related protein
MKMKPTTTLLTALLLSLIPLLARAQERPPTFTEEVEVRVMDLDVVVTDKAGRPVTDLTRDDFTVRLGGRTVPLDYFARVDEGTIHAPDLATASPDQVLAEYRRGTEAYVPRHFLIYVDLGHLAPDARKRGLEALRDLVTRMGPNDMGRVLMFDRRSKELTEWTNSKEQLFGALTKIEKAGVGMSRLLTERQTLRDLDFTRSRSSRQFMARQYAEQERVEVRQMLSDMGSELATLSPLAGKKAFLFVSGGFEFQPGYAMATYALGPASLLALDVRNMGPELDELARRANASEITFYTIDARGLTGEGVSASNDDPLMSRPGVSFLARQDSQEGMVHLARETGGLALLNSNDLHQGLSRIYQDTSMYYSIGITLSKLPAASYQDVRVEVNRPGAVVRARRGYAPRTEEDRARDRVQATLKTNLAYGAIPMTLRTAPATKQGGKFTVPISVTLPATALTFVPEGSERRATADVAIGVMDDAGRMSDVSRQEATFTLPEGKNDAEPLVYTATLQTRKGNQRIVVNLRDRASGKMGTAKADVRIE